MIFSAVLFGIAQTLFLLYFLYDMKVFSNLPNHGELLSFLAGVAMVGVVLSAESFFLSFAKLGKKKRFIHILPLVFAVVAEIISRVRLSKVAADGTDMAKEDETEINSEAVTENEEKDEIKSENKD